ncbi:MAG TPA: DUF4867 family protein [Erysipelotrichaceae bacterium]|nr:DUF4867 family protein [Erysipelotrichaceae bacterium]
MKIFSVYDQEFAEYGRIIEDNFDDIYAVLSKIERPFEVVYNPSFKPFEQLKSFNILKNHYYGGMPIQVGYCAGHNKTLNCLEYHLDSEINMSDEEFILLLGLRSQIKNGKFDTSLVKAFKIPAKTAVEIYATSLHYAPCSKSDKGFRVLVVLPKGTNIGKIKSDKEPMLFMTNKWLLAHPESIEVKNGAYIGLEGDNLTI